jgi:hypothetical protein
VRGRYSPEARAEPARYRATLREFADLLRIVDA